jgi:hypothetical protein
VLGSRSVVDGADVGLLAADEVAPVVPAAPPAALLGAVADIVVEGAAVDGCCSDVRADVGGRVPVGRVTGMLGVEPAGELGATGGISDVLGSGVPAIVPAGPVVDDGESTVLAPSVTAA